MLGHVRKADQTPVCFNVPSNVTMGEDGMKNGSNKRHRQQEN
jgi:hypothetical protein